MKILGLNIPFTRVEDKVQNTPNSADLRRYIKTPTQVYRITTDLAKYRNAVNSAENIHEPFRYNLYQLYNQTVLDAHVTAAITQRKNLTLQKEFYVYNPDGSENDEKTKLIRTKWFYDYLDLALDSLFWGHSLIQFEDIIEMNGVEQFKCIDLVPRIYVKPELHIVTSDYAATTGKDYLEKPFINWCIGVGKPKDLGLLLKITPLQIWKKNALGAWAEYTEKFGTPIRIGKTSARDKETTTNMENMLRNMGTAAWGLFDLEDTIELIESNKTDAYQVFDMMIQRCNSEISKLVLGQTSTLDEKAFVGSAEVHERVLQSYAWADELFINGVNNYQLIPMLNALGFGLEGMTIGVETEEELTLLDQSKIDIELIKTGKYKFTPEYIKDKYGSEVIEVEEVVDKNNIKTVSNLLDKYYT